MFLTSFFLYFTCLWFSKNCKFFVLFSCMDPRFYEKYLQNYGFVLKKNLRYLKYKISTKFHRLQFLFYFFLHFWRCVFYFNYPNLSKNDGIFCSVLFEELEILAAISGKLKKFFLKKLICEIFFFSKFCGLLFVFFIFFLFLTFYFQFRLCVLVKKLYKFLWFFILWIRDFIKEFWKIIENIFQKNIDIRNPKFFINSIVYYLFFLFFYHFGNVFFLFDLSKLVKKSIHFCGALLYGL